MSDENNHEEGSSQGDWNDGIDNDGDGNTDCQDDGCASKPVCSNVDNDQDGAVAADDCDDNDPTSTIVAQDADCDGVLTADDCNDT